MTRFPPFRAWTVGLGASLLAALPALAEPPDLDNGGFARGETEVEVNAWTRRAETTVRPELELGLRDGLGLEFQLDLDRASGTWSVDAVSAQLSKDLSADGGLGVAFEAGVTPDDGGLLAETFVYATRVAGPWRVDVNAGVEREDGALSAAYAWRVARAAGRGWRLGLEGGGEAPLDKGRDSHRFGPVLAWGDDDEGLGLAIGVSRETGGRYQLRLGLERTF